MERIKNKFICALAIGSLSIAMITGTIMTLGINNVHATTYPAESKALGDAKAKISHLTKSLKTNYLGIKNQATWELYIKEARGLIEKIPNYEKYQKDALTVEVDKDEALVKGLARINHVEKSIAPKSEGGYGNHLGIKNAETWREYLRLAKIDLEKVDKSIFKKQYDELISRMNNVDKVVQKIEDDFQVEYDKVVKLYEEAKALDDLDKANEALENSKKLGSCNRTNELEKNIEKLIKDIEENNIITVQPETDEQLKTYKSSSYFNRDYIEIMVIDNKKIKIKGRSDLGKTGLLFMIEGNKTLREYRNVKEDGTYEEIFNIEDYLTYGDYKLGIYFKDKNDTSYWSYYWKIPLKCENGEVFFPRSPVYENNYIEYTKNSKVNPNKYLDINITDKDERDEIKNLAYDIIGEESNDYEKLLKINNWVAENIYYNWDGYLSGDYGRTDAYGTFKSRKSVCQGYAELTNELLKSIGIPSKLVIGHALGVSSSNKYWDDIDHTSSNHAWNEAFVNGRWIILDTTWNSGNKYENGKFNKKKMNYRYFDPTLEVFSYNHKIIEVR